MKKNTILLTAGLALCVCVIAKVGWTSALSQISRAGAALPIILALSFLRLCAQTSSWSIAIGAEGMGASKRKLMGIRLASQGTGYLSPLGPAVSEPMKIRLLGILGEWRATATLVDTGTYWFTSALFGIFACTAAGLLVPHGRRMTTLLLAMSAILAGGLYLIARRKSLLDSLVRRIGSRCPRWLRKAEQIESTVRCFARRHPRAIREMIWRDLWCQVLLAAEVAAVFWMLGIPVHVGKILALEAANRGVKMLTGWLPARIGADEGATAGIFAALGLASTSGLALALTRRARDLIACGAGFVWLAWKTGIKLTQENMEVVTCRQ